MRGPLLCAFSAILLIFLIVPTLGLAQDRSSAPLADEEYRLGPEDVLEVQVWGRPELTGSVTVDFTGRILIPLLGEVRAAGRTPLQLSEDLTERYQLLDPSVSEVLVAVTEYKSRSVMVVGEVHNPGPFGFRDMPNVWEAILTAGGLTSEAETSRVQIVRGERREGESHTITVDLSRGIERTPPESLPELRPRDKIMVPSSEGMPTGGENFHVLGAVAVPGIYRLAQAEDVVQALAVSGGPTSDAMLKSVYLTRPTSVGVVSYHLDLEGYLSAAQPMANLQLEPGDTITVPEKSSFWRSLGEFMARLAPWASLAVTVLLVR